MTQRLWYLFPCSLGEASLLPPPWPPTWGLEHRGLAVLNEKDDVLIDRMFVLDLFKERFFPEYVYVNVKDGQDLGADSIAFNFIALIIAPDSSKY